MAAINLKWLFKFPGPIFTKELRVAGRRRRNYALRFIYVALLGLFVGATWAASVEWQASSNSLPAYQMAAAGRQIAMTIAWFQFCAIQFLAVILLSTSISDEIYRKTMPALWTTPITDFQILSGKLASKMLHLVTLLLMSMPVLALLRVLGGVPWEFVLSSTCITLAAGLFAGCVSMFYSILFRRAFSTVIMSLATLFFLYAVVPLIGGLMLFPAFFESGKFAEDLAIAFMHANPFAALAAETAIAASGSGGMPFYWPINCAVMAGLAALVFLPSVRMVRRVAVRRAMGGSASKSVRAWQPVPAAIPPPATPRANPPGQTDAPPPLPGQTVAAPPSPKSPPEASGGPRAAGGAGAHADWTSQFSSSPPPAPQPPAGDADLSRLHIGQTYLSAYGPIREVTGSPIMWKEMHTRSGRLARTIGFWLLVGLVILLYCLISSVSWGGMANREVQSAFVIVFLCAASLYTAVQAATGISTEKESRSLPILLTTALTDGQIVMAKAAGVWRRCWPAWALLIGHAIIFACCHVLRPIVLVHLSLLAGWMMFCLTGAGLYFSSRFKKTTTAVVCNLMFGVCIWLVGPYMIQMFTSRHESVPRDVVLDVNPFVQAYIVTDGATIGENYPSEDQPYDWPDGHLDAATTTWMMAIIALLNAGVGFLFFWRAKRRLRKNIF